MLVVSCVRLNHVWPSSQEEDGVAIGGRCGHEFGEQLDPGHPLGKRSPEQPRCQNDGASVGIDHVAIGTDLDANYRPVLTSYSQFPDVAELLRYRGLDDGEVDKVLGGNFVRLFEDVESASSLDR